MPLLKNILLFLMLTQINCQLKKEYYASLIQQKIVEAENYQLPESNEEFKIDETTEIQDFGNYDFVVVGAGTAGSVVATRLSEIRHWKVLVLEAGDEEDDFSVIPGASFILLQSKRNWGYKSTSQETVCLGMKDNKCVVPRGKSVGGSSAINGVFNVRGNPKDYDKIHNPAWSYKDVLPYFLKSENSQVDGDRSYHGTGGIWNLENPSPPSDLFKTLVEGSAELNYSCVDYNGESQIGVSRTQNNIKFGKRQSTGTAFLHNARRRNNVKVVTKALVTKINIDKSIAQGVEFITNNVTYKATAKKEVIVSAGAVNSPQLLMLSGIGPKKHLKEIGISLVADLPVGENLMDHPAFLGLNFHTNYQYNFILEPSIDQFLKGYGPLTKYSNLDGTGFIPKKDGPNDVPMIQYMFFPPGGLLSNVGTTFCNYNNNLINNYLHKLNPQSNVAFLLLLLHQKSRGRITLKSKSPIDFPNIDLNLFSDPEDIDNMIEGIEFILKLTQTKAFQEINATLVEIPICKDLEKNSKEFWICAVRHMSMSAFHLTGTTSMGTDKSTSVVDHNLEVHGIGKLRVVDAGIFPVSLSGPTFSPTVMVAEKISDVIKDDYNTEEKNSSSLTDHRANKESCLRNS